MYRFILPMAAAAVLLTSSSTLAQKPGDKKVKVPDEIRKVLKRAKANVHLKGCEISMETKRTACFKDFKTQAACMKAVDRAVSSCQAAVRLAIRRHNQSSGSDDDDAGSAQSGLIHPDQCPQCKDCPVCDEQPECPAAAAPIEETSFWAQPLAVPWPLPVFFVLLMGGGIIFLTIKLYGKSEQVAPTPEPNIQRHTVTPSQSDHPDGPPDMVDRPEKTGKIDMAEMDTVPEGEPSRSEGSGVFLMEGAEPPPLKGGQHNIETQVTQKPSADPEKDIKTAEVTRVREKLRLEGLDLDDE